jgi:hypothetical protein
MVMTISILILLLKSLQESNTFNNFVKENIGSMNDAHNHIWTILFRYVCNFM